jgi:hypothetical protein
VIGLETSRLEAYWLKGYLEGPEDAGGCLEDAVDAVGHMEAVGPVVVGHRPVVLLHSDEKPHLKHREIMNYPRNKQRELQRLAVNK